MVEERRKVQDTILSMYHFPVGMELFSAADEDQWEVIRETIDCSDYYILIIGHRYGSVILNGPDKGISYTEKEYRYAKEIGIPILVFIIDDSVKISSSDIEVEHRKELDAFKDEVKIGRIVQWWKSSDDLANQVMNALYKQFSKNKRPGWIKADTFNIEDSHAELLNLNKQIRGLQEENRKLNEEIQTFRKYEQERYPQLSISLSVDKLDDEYGDMCHPNYSITDDNGFILGVKVYKAQLDRIDREYKRITEDDFPAYLLEFARQEEIDEYNECLPSSDVIRKYKESLKEYYQAINGSVHICIGVHNDGTSKASNASLVIEFPKELEVYDCEILELSEPKAPKVGKNPIGLANQRRKERINRFAALSYRNILSSIPTPTYNTGKSILENVIKHTNLDFVIYEHTLEINCGTVVHTKSHLTRGVFLVGKKPGKYKIKYSLMCEEYREPQVGWTDFEITDYDE